MLFFPTSAKRCKENKKERRKKIRRRKTDSGRMMMSLYQKPHHFGQQFHFQANYRASRDFHHNLDHIVHLFSRQGRLYSLSLSFRRWEYEMKEAYRRSERLWLLTNSCGWHTPGSTKVLQGSGEKKKRSPY